MGRFYLSASLRGRRSAPLKPIPGKSAVATNATGKERIALCRDKVNAVLTHFCSDYSKMLQRRSKIPAG
jgi:hypothetical protein